MPRPILIACLLFAAPSLADETVGAAPSAGQLGRYSVVHAGDLTARFDSATGATWYLCMKKGKQAWCRAKDVPAQPNGPVGRYKLVEGAPLVLLDTVTGRTWQRCELPTPEKGLAWCALED